MQIVFEENRLLSVVLALIHLLSIWKSIMGSNPAPTNSMNKLRENMQGQTHCFYIDFSRENIPLFLLKVLLPSCTADKIWNGGLGHYL